MSAVFPGVDFMSIHCDAHSRRWRIASFSRGLTSPEWSEILAVSKDRRAEQARVKEDIEKLPPEDPDAPFNFDDFIQRVVPGGDRPGHATRLVEGVPTHPLDAKAGLAVGASQPREWQTFDLTCPRCKKARRHVSYARRSDALFRIFDELASLGVTEASPEFLHKFEARRAGNPG